MKKGILLLISFIMVSSIVFAKDIIIVKTDIDREKYEAISSAYIYRTQPLHMDIKEAMDAVATNAYEMCQQHPECVSIYNYEVSISNSTNGRIFLATFDLVREKK